ncbi:jg19632 [Pararge aegeria aegeria]|uniref:beta-N-acetylhexosaminidase n=1 Tax=Pararge aegeria aegeria TaxID=348720 RepID=A0A8S4SD67_9NEOP|nr:jg19632 [Pararge aegeria aegeria]
MKNAAEYYKASDKAPNSLEKKMEFWRWWTAATLGLVCLVSSQDTTVPPAPIVYEPSWTYKCVPDEGCHRSAHPQPTSSNSSGMVFASVDLCRTVCGRFGGLWPRPVTAAISMQTVRIHPNFLRFDLSNAPVETREILVEMTHVTTQNLIDECDGNVSVVVETPVVVYITVKTTNLDLTLDTQEQYRLDVQSKGTFDLSNAPVETREILVEMTHVTTQNLIDECDGNVSVVVETPVVVYITVKTTNLDLTLDTQEQYRLDVQSKGCWNSSEEIVSYMESKNYDTSVDGFIKLWSEFHEKALEIWDEELSEIGQEDKQPVMLWSSELTQAHRIQKHLSKDRYIIEVWEPINSPLLGQLIRLGYKVVSVPKDIWYLDHGFWGKTTYSNWRRMYAHTLPRDPHVLGGEVAAWSEYVDSQGLDTRALEEFVLMYCHRSGAPNTTIIVFSYHGLHKNQSLTSIFED